MGIRGTKRTFLPLEVGQDPSSRIQTTTDPYHLPANTHTLLPTAKHVRVTLVLITLQLEPRLRTSNEDHHVVAIMLPFQPDKLPS